MVAVRGDTERLSGQRSNTQLVCFMVSDSVQGIGFLVLTQLETVVLCDCEFLAWSVRESPRNNGQVPLGCLMLRRYRLLREGLPCGLL